MSFLSSRKLVLLFVIILMAGALLISCAPAEEEVVEPEPDPVEEEGPREGGKVVWARRDAPTTLDPMKHGEAAANQINALMGGNLVALDSWEGEYVPLHAEEWDVSEDGTVFTFYLRDDIKWHTGRQLTAHDYVYTYDRAFDPDTGAVQTLGFLEDVVDYEALDDFTFQVTLEEPSAVFLASAATAYTKPVDKEYIEEVGDDDYARNPSGVGAWKFDHWVTGESVTLVRNEDFAWAEPWFENQGPPYIEELQFRYFPEEATLLAALEAGEVDIASLPAHAVDRFEEHDDFEVAVNLQMGMGRWFMPNMEREIWQDERVRHAVAHALDRDFFIETSLEGRAVPAYGPMSPPMMMYNEKVEDLAPRYNPEKAEQLLDDAGWVMGDDGVREKDGEEFEILLLTRTEELQMRDAEIAQGLLEEIGIKVEIESFERALHTEKVRDGEHDLSIGQYWWSSGDPDVLYFFFHSSQSPGGLNSFHLKDPRVDELLENQRTAVDPDERAEYVHEVQELLVEEQFAFFVYITEEYSAIHNRIQDWMVTPAGGIQLNDAWIDE